MSKIAFIILVVLFLFPGCSKKESCHEEGPVKSCCTESKKSKDLNSRSDSLSEFSLYNLSSEWIREDGQKIKLESFQGKPQLIALIYTSCSYACPRIISDLKGIEEGLGEYKSEDYGIILVTMDPETDTPAKLKDFAIENKMDSKKWKLLNGNPEDVRELSILLNVKYKKTADNNISHSNIISVLNEKGEVVYQEEGLGVDSKGTIDALTNLLKKQKMPM